MRPPFLLDDVTVLIATFSKIDCLRDTLFTMLTYSDFPLKTIVVNNNVVPEYRGQVDALVAQTQCKSVDVRHLGDNFRDTGAFNRAMICVETKYVAMLSDDLVFVPGCGRKFWEDMLRVLWHPQVGAVGPSNDATWYYQHACAFDLPDVIEVPALHGNFVIFKTALYKEMGGYDELLTRGPDLDISYRLTARGYKLICVRTSFVHHIGAATYRELIPDYHELRDLKFKEKWPNVDSEPPFELKAWNP